VVISYNGTVVIAGVSAKSGQISSLSSAGGVMSVFFSTSSNILCVKAMNATSLGVKVVKVSDS